MSKPPKHAREKRGGMICRDCYGKTGNVGSKTADLGEALEETEMDDPMKDPNVLEKAEDHLRSQLELAEAAGDEDAEKQLLKTLTLIIQNKKELQNKEKGVKN